MRYSIIAAFTTVLIGTVWAQPAPKPANDVKQDGANFSQPWPWPGSWWLPANDPKMSGAYFKLEVLGWLRIWDPLDADPRTLQVYYKRTGVELGAEDGFHIIRGFELYLGDDPKFVKAARELDRKWVVVEGDLAIVHGPVQVLFGSGLEQQGLTEYSHPRPRYVIKVRHLSAAPAGVPNLKQQPYIKIEVHGVLSTRGTNPSLSDISANKDWPKNVIRTDQCNLLLYLGKDDKWLPRAKELNGKPAVARGELIDVGRDAPNPRQLRPAALVVPLPFYMLNVTDLQPAPAAPDRDDKKK